MNVNDNKLSAPELQDALNGLMQPLLAVYGNPNTDDFGGWLYEHANVLKRYVRSELEHAKGLVLERHRGNARWPRMWQIIAACEDARTALAARHIAERKKLPQPEYTRQQLRDAEQFVDLCAAGEIDMGLCHVALQKLAISMRARRIRRIAEDIDEVQP